MRACSAPKRRGVVAIEGAVVYSAFLALVFMLVIGGAGVFRYQLVAALASEAARFGSVRGSAFADETQSASPTAQEIYDRAVAPLVIGMDRSKLTLRVEWINTTTDEVFDWDAAPKRPYNQSTTGVVETNRIRVTVLYRWFPECFLGGPLTMTAVTELPMAF